MVTNSGQALVERIVGYIERYVKFPENRPGQSLVCALWVIHTWLYEHYSATPYLDIAASTKQSGKTLLMEVLQTLSRNGKMFASLRTLAIVRLIEAYEGKITCFFDEAERLASEAVGDTRSLLATGYLKGGVHAVTSGKTTSEFRVYCPKCFAQIGDIQPVLRDRAIVVDLERPASGPGEDFRANRELAEADAAQIVREMGQLITSVPPTMPPAFLSGREREIWTPINSIALALGLHVDTMRTLQGAMVDMGARKLQPARHYSSAVDEKTAEERTYGERLLRDAVSILGDERNISTAELLARLRAIPTAPWRTFRGTGLTEDSLSVLLRPFGLGPDAVRVGKGRKGSTVLMGYKAKELRAAVPAAK